MTDTANLQSLRLLADLAAFLRDPVIKLQHSDEMAALQVQVADLQHENQQLRIENEQLLAKYRDELFRQWLCRISAVVTVLSGGRNTASWEDTF